MTESVQVGVIVSARASGGFVVLDGLGRQHYAHDTAELGEIVAALSVDPDLPAYESEGAAMAALEQAAIHLVTSQIPDSLRPIAPVLGRVAADGVANGVKKGWGWLQELGKRKAEKKRKAAQPQAPSKPKAKPAPDKPKSPPVVAALGPQTKATDEPPKVKPKRARVVGASLRFAEDRKAAGGKG